MNRKFFATIGLVLALFITTTAPAFAAQVSQRVHPNTGCYVQYANSDTQTRTGSNGATWQLHTELDKYVGCGELLAFSEATCISRCGSETPFLVVNLVDSHGNGAAENQGFGTYISTGWINIECGAAGGELDFNNLQSVIHAGSAQRCA